MPHRKIPLSAKGFFASESFVTTNQNILLLTASEEEALNCYGQLTFFLPKKQDSIKLFRGLDTIPYDRVSPSHLILADRAKVLSDLATANERECYVVITSASNILTKLPPPATFTEARLKITVGDRLTIEQISSFLSQNGFYRTSLAATPGEFAVRGEIMDIALDEKTAYRLSFSWDRLESIKKLDMETQVSTSLTLQTINIDTSSEVLLGPEQISTFKNNYLTCFGVNHTGSPLYNAILEGRKFPGYENFLPLFYNKLTSLFGYLDRPLVIYDNLCLQSIAEHENSYRDFYQSRLQSNKINPDSYYPALPPEKFLFPTQEVRKTIALKSAYIDPGADSKEQEIISLPNITNINSSFEQWIELLKSNINKKIIISAISKSSLERLKTLVHNYEYPSLEIGNLAAAKKGIINLAITPLTTGFTTEEYLIITGRDIFGEKYTEVAKLSSKRKLKNILTELDNLRPGELVVHKEHGIGRFIDVEIIEVQGKPHDCLKILYADNDKLYIPVENIEAIKKYGSEETELDRLGSLSWQKRKSKLKNRIKEIAGSLIKTAAERELLTLPPVEFDQAGYEGFSARFNYAETEDQLNAINDIKADLAGGKLMDRLICGDVGFGKTEVAMRAAYMVAASHASTAPQVAIIAPTTILCQQHYQRFMERFQGLGLPIAQLSRLVKPAKAKNIKDQLKKGEINIIIGTHALLSRDVGFKNLKLLIIDEEQHFGVGQKERLKELKSGVHTLSLSATPIPRTLQMSMVGIKDLSLIATPPIDRLAIRTTVMPFDPVIIRDALLREKFRGGRSFYVSPRIKDIVDVEKSLNETAPELTYRVAHGQMPPAKVDEIMSDFCEGKFDILLSTTIIESGIDIASANTIIIHKASKLGLSQLYQLRGRIGRGKLRGYAYLCLDQKKTSPEALRRLEIMQSIESLGAGFTIASHDMDLRGFGNLVGEEQSGHIREVGSELYQEMLDQAIAELQSGTSELNEEQPTSINLGLPVFIPEYYIDDSTLRLGIYRRIGNLVTEEEVEHFRDEMIDRFGPIPSEFNNLLNIVKIKQQCSKLQIASLDSGDKGFLIKFRQGADVTGMVMNFIGKYPRHAKLKPDNKLAFLKELNSENILGEVGNLLRELTLL